MKMKQKYIRYLLIPVLAVMLGHVEQVSGQNCAGYDKKCPSAPKGFKSSTLSRSVSIKKMRKIVINQVFYGDRTYQISVCGKSRLGKIQYRLLSDDETRSVLYDNAVDNFKQIKLFEIQSTMKIVIEITAPHYFDEATSECAGVKIYYKSDS
jgi:hypothetical protein